MKACGEELVLLYSKRYVVGSGLKAVIVFIQSSSSLCSGSELAFDVRPACMTDHNRNALEHEAGKTQMRETMYQLAASHIQHVE